MWGAWLSPSEVCALPPLSVLGEGRVQGGLGWKAKPGLCLLLGLKGGRLSKERGQDLLRDSLGSRPAPPWSKVLQTARLSEGSCQSCRTEEGAGEAEVLRAKRGWLILRWVISTTEQEPRARVWVRTAALPPAGCVTLVISLECQLPSGSRI